jgi:hypothetical protein
MRKIGLACHNSVRAGARLTDVAVGLTPDLA